MDEMAYSDWRLFWEQISLHKPTKQGLIDKMLNWRVKIL